MSQTVRRLSWLLVPTLLLATPTLPGQAPSPAGTWSGTWSSPDGSVYSAKMELTLSANGAIEGSILWTLSAATRPDLKPKVGQSGTEYVQGTYKSDCRVIHMGGFKLGDPNHILGMDQYELILAPNGGGLGGVTENNGPWTGAVSFRR